VAARRDGDEVHVAGILRNGRTESVEAVIVDVGVYAPDGRIVGHDAVYPVGFRAAVPAGATVRFAARLYDPEGRIASGSRVEALAEARVPSS
jgi:hypothetical protein